MPDSSKEYIDEWRHKHPEWIIKKWDESNLPSDIPYLSNALSGHKWANVSNFMRLFALMADGGVYLDTDIKIIKPLDELLDNQCFLGFEDGTSEEPGSFWVNNAVFGSVKGGAFVDLCYRKLLEEFDGLEEANLSAPRLITSLLRKEYGLTSYGLQTLRDVTIYPRSFFYPIHYSEAYKLSNIWDYITDQTVAVHMWSRTWLTSGQLLKMFDELQYDYLKKSEENDRFKTDLDYIKRAVDRLPAAAFQNEMDTVLSTNTELSRELSRLTSMQDVFLKKIQDKDAQLALLNEEVKTVRSQFMEAENILVSFQKDKHREELLYLEKIRALEKENATIRKEAEEKRIRVEEMDKKFQQLTQSFSDAEMSLRYSMNTIEASNVRLEEMLAEKVRELVGVIAEKEESAKREIEERNKSERLVADLRSKEMECENLLAELQRLKAEIARDEVTRRKLESDAAAERRRLSNEIQLRDEQLRIKRHELKNLEARVGEISTAYRDYQVVQEANNADLISMLQGKANEYKSSIAWYQATYENRRLLGIIKEKVKRVLK